MDAQVLFGQRLRELRSQRGYSQEGFAHHAGLDRTYVSGLERGRRNPTLAVIVRLAAALDVPVQALFEGVAEMPPVRRVALGDDQTHESFGM